MNRTTFYISDGTGITVQALGRSLLSQFGQINGKIINIPYVDTVSKAEAALKQINLAFAQDGQKSLVFSSLVNVNLRNIIVAAHALVLDFFNSFTEPLEQELKQKSRENIGQAHGVKGDGSYLTRMDAVNFTLSCDDGANIHNYDRADVILVGVSRCGKTPTSLYLALQFGVFAANYPFTDNDINSLKLPKNLSPYRQKLYGLTIAPERLHRIREKRRSQSDYAALATCKREVREIENLFRNKHIAFINTTERSIEEISTLIINQQGLG